MHFERDDAKRQINSAKHDIDFFDMRVVFDGRPERRLNSDCGEERRFATTAVVDDRFYTVIWTRRFDVIRIISARRARSGEERACRAVYG